MGMTVELTELIKEELAGAAANRRCCRRAEVATLLRLSAGVEILGGRMVVKVMLDTEAGACQLRGMLREVYGQTSEGHVVRAAAGGRPVGYVVRVLGDSHGLMRQVGLLDPQSRVVRGLPAPVVGGGSCDAAASWRGAFLAQGRVNGTGRRQRLDVLCPSREVALALVGAARRLGVPARNKPVSDTWHVAVRDDTAVATLLGAIGAPRAALTWQQRATRPSAPNPAMRGPSLHEANERRMASAAASAAQRVERALAALGGDVPEHLAAAGTLRLAHRQASLEELGGHADPPLSKDAMAGRIRRLLQLADRKVPEISQQP